MTKDEAIKNIVELTYLLIDTEQKKKIIESIKTLTALDDLPSVTPQPKWIPVSEKLPEEYVPVMVSTKLSVFPEARYSKTFGWEWAYASDNNDWRRLNNIVTAWMPLPEPFEESEEEE